MLLFCLLGRILLKLQRESLFKDIHQSLLWDIQSCSNKAGYSRNVLILLWALSLVRCIMLSYYSCFVNVLNTVFWKLGWVHGNFILHVFSNRPVFYPIQLMILYFYTYVYKLGLKGLFPLYSVFKLTAF